MEVKDIYKDENAVWHIEYGLDHLMGLSIRIWLGQLIIGLFFYIPLMLILSIGSFFLGLHFDESTLNESNKVENQFNIPEIVD